MGVFDGVLIAKTGAGYLESLIFRPNKTIAVITESAAIPPKMSGYFLISPGKEAVKREINADVIFSYNYKTPVKITENPCENGILINDHRIIQPRVVTIDVGFNNIVGIEDVLTNLDVGTAIQAAKLYIFGNRFDAKSRVAAKYADLLIAMYSGDMFDLVTPLGTFNDMVIIDIDSTQDSDSISVFRGTITYQQIIKYKVLINASTDASMVNPPENIGLQIPSPISSSLLPAGVSF